MRGGGPINKPIETDGDRGSIPADDLRSFMEEDLPYLDERPAPPETPHRAVEAREVLPMPVVRHLPIPKDIDDIFSVEANREELFTLIRWHRRLQEQTAEEVTFHTPIGSVRCQLAHFQEQDGLLQLFLTEAQRVFSPNVGSVLNLSVGKGAALRHYRAMCVLPPIPLPGISIALMLLSVEDTSVEKHARLEPDAPSVVSGKPSNTTSNGEPVAGLEKAAAATVLPPRDFDVSRDRTED